jgi:hypothetical protein
MSVKSIIGVVLALQALPDLFAQNAYILIITTA